MAFLPASGSNDSKITFATLACNLCHKYHRNYWKLHQFSSDIKEDTRSIYLLMNQNVINMMMDQTVSRVMFPLISAVA